MALLSNGRSPTAILHDFSSRGPPRGSMLPQALNQPGNVKLLDQVREAVRLRHYSKRTEDTYVY